MCFNTYLMNWLVSQCDYLDFANIILQTSNHTVKNVRHAKHVCARKPEALWLIAKFTWLLELCILWVWQDMVFFICSAFPGKSLNQLINITRAMHGAYLGLLINIIC